LKPLNFNKALLDELEIRTLRAERRHLYNQLLEIDSRDGMKYVNIAHRLDIINKKLFKLTGNAIYR
jgi:hypothetical protein